ncbi:MAG: hypothetical protein ACE1ZS_08575, partial [Candidatus Poribacteria bacterium]
EIDNLHKEGIRVLFTGRKDGLSKSVLDDMERSTVVCHYQVTPMYEGIWHVSRPRGYEGTFPFAKQ